MSIVDRIQMLCAEKGITITELEQILGIGRGIIKRWNISEPRAYNLVKVSRYFRVTTDYLLGMEEVSYPRSTRLIINALADKEITEQQLGAILQFLDTLLKK